MELTPKEIELYARVGFDVEVARLLKSATGQAVEQAFCYDYEIEPEAANALCALAGATYPNLDAINAALPNEYRAYVGVRREDNGAEIGPELVILRDTDPLAFARCRRPDGVNYDISAEQVMAKLEDWHARFGITIRRADHDQVELSFASLPENLTAFAEEIYWFCRDVTDVDGEMMNIEGDTDLLTRARELPDVSAEFREQYQARIREVFDDYELGDAIGLKLLAARLERDRNLFLWWD